MPRVLILGADGAIGGHMAGRLASLGHEVTGTTRRPDRLGCGRVVADLAAPDFSPRSLPQADIVLICAAMARFAECREQPDLARRVNVDAPLAVARHVLADGGRVILLSTSAVLDCAAPRMAASRPRAPRSAYGQMKAEVETALLGLGASVSVLRLTKVVTPEMALLAGWIAALRVGTPIRAFSDMTISPISLADVEAALLATIASDEGGLWQVSAADDVSYADIAMHLAKRLHCGPDLVRPAPASDAGIPPGEILRFTSLDTGRVESTSPWRPRGGLDLIDQLYRPILA